MNNPKVSIVLPVYNGEKYLAESIESCTAQTFNQWELIIVDDSSTDRTPEIIKRYTESDSRILYVRNDENRKLPASLNIGFSSARGEYLTWTSDDNAYRPEAISEMVTYLEMHAEYSVVYSDYSIIDEDGCQLEIYTVPPPEELVLRNAIGACFLYRREVHEAVNGYDESKFLVEDYDFWLRVSQRVRIADPLRKVLYDYRNHGETLTAKRGAEIDKALILLLAEHLPKMNWAGRRKVAEGYAWLGNAAIDRDLIAWGWTSWLMAVIKWPTFSIVVRFADLTVWLLKRRLSRLFDHDK